MKIISVSILIFLTSLKFVPLQACELRIYTYDSLIDKKGFGSKFFPYFEEQSQCKLKIVSDGDANRILARVKLDQRLKKKTAHILFGIDQQLWPQVESLAESFRLKSLDLLEPKLRVGKGFIPFDYGIFAFIADRKKMKELKLELPKSYQDLLSLRLKKKFILEHPQTSSPGLGFLMTTSAIFSESELWQFWKQLKSQWLAMPSSWTEAYGLFMKGEAPLVWSYTTSAAYHRAHGDTQKRYQALTFSEGHSLQIEGAMAVKSSLETEEEKQISQKFLELLVSEKVQAWIPETQWMYPARQHTKLPKSFEDLPQPSKILKIELKDPGKLEREWARAIR